MGLKASIKDPGKAFGYAELVTGGISIGANGTVAAAYAKDK